MRKVKRDPILVVTRCGHGEILRFDSFLEAISNALVQYGDPVITHRGQFEKVLNEKEILRLIQARGYDGDWSHDDVWKFFIENSVPPPEDPNELIANVRKDRLWVLKNFKPNDRLDIPNYVMYPDHALIIPMKETNWRLEGGYNHRMVKMILKARGTLTVGEYLEKGGQYLHLRDEHNRGNIKIHNH